MTRREYQEMSEGYSLATPALKCPDCGASGERLSAPDFEGFVDCYDCGAAWIPGEGDVR